ncbi:MAG TPA: phage tail sheath C-terminal domain-containing protein [Thermoanaerobaculia bacterium]|nr:phage tail sheath C-terminal domain-containing protein [Thermoanaerobaculia bacterium]
MPVQVSYPGIYIEELPNTNQVVTGVTTSSTAFVDYFRRGPITITDNAADLSSPTFTPLAFQINNWSDFQRLYGGIDGDSEATYAAYQYYLNGGMIGWFVRVVSDDAALASSNGAGFLIQSANPGAWGNNLQVTLSRPVPVGNQIIPDGTFNLSVAEIVQGRQMGSESYLNLTLNPSSAMYAPAVINSASRLIRIPAPAGSTVGPAAIPAANDPNPPVPFLLKNGANGAIPGPGVLTQDANLDALDRIAPAVFNTLCLPATAKAGVSTGEMSNAMTAALAFCGPRKAFYIVDIPQNIVTVEAMQSWAQTYVLGEDNYSGAVYFPRLIIPDPSANFQPRNVGASGTLAGVYARVDVSEGVWKAPAGTEAVLQGADIAVPITDAQNGQLNPLGINALRSFPVFGNLSWGARTLAGADQISSQWKYIPVRRLLDYIELSLQQSLKWTVFQPNDDGLWANIRVSVGNFLAGLYSQGAFAGASAASAYFVHCDSSTTTQTDIDQGIVNIIIGVAPVQPAEFVILQIQQIAGQTS